MHNLSADKHFVIGTNIDGFMRFVHKDWAEFLNNLPFSQKPEEILLRLARKLRICFTKEDLKERLFAMGAKGYEGDLFDIKDLKTFGEKQKLPALEALLHFHQKNINMFQEYHTLYQKLLIKPDKPLFKETLTKWFMNKFIFPDKNNAFATKKVLENLWILKKLIGIG